MVRFLELETQDVLLERQTKLLKVFHYWACDRGGTARGSQRFGGPTMTFNDFLPMMQECRLLDSRLDVRRLCKAYGLATCNDDILPQMHPNNADSEMTFDEFLECLSRCAEYQSPPDRFGERLPLADILRNWLDKRFFFEISKIFPQRL
mmetsp:Transcript_41785/g.50661  ORF Transcript_41785/g.50661 Transcript_41785/m.50661 type:complete len:149 (+) Transcript_41785:1-447(+)